MKVRTPIKPMFVVKRPMSIYVVCYLHVIVTLCLIYTSIHWYKAAEQANTEATSRTEQLVACLNGLAAWKSTDGVEVGCFKAVTNGN